MEHNYKLNQISELNLFPLVHCTKHDPMWSDNNIQVAINQHGPPYDYGTTVLLRCEDGYDHKEGSTHAICIQHDTYYIDRYPYCEKRKFLKEVRG